MKKTCNIIGKVFFKHPFFMYVFIIPVYTPTRILSADFSRYMTLIPSEYARLNYFLLVFFFIGFSGIVLSLLLKACYYFEEKKILSQLNKQRVYSLLISPMFIVSTYYMFFSPNCLYLTLISGLHYFCIAYLGNLAILETKYYKLPFNNKTKQFTKAVNSTLVAIIVNIFGVAFFLLLNFFRSQDEVIFYSYFCVFLECALFFYFLVAKSYWRDVLLYINNTSLGSIIVIFALFGFAVSACILSAELIFLNPLSILIFIPILPGYAFFMSKRVGFRNVQNVFSGSFSYGIVLLVFMTPILLNLQKGGLTNSGNYSELAIIEPVMGFLLAFLLFYSILKDFIKSDELSFNKQIIVSASIILVLPVILYRLKLSYSQLYIIIFFIAYSIIETFTQYGVRGIIFNIANDRDSILLNYFNIMILQAFTPAVYLSILYLNKKFFNNTPDVLYYSVFIMIVLFALSLISSIISSVNSRYK